MISLIGTLFFLFSVAGGSFVAGYALRDELGKGKE